MLKIEYVWRHLLTQAIEHNNPDFTLSHLAARYKLSTSVVHHALAPLKDLGIVEVGKRNSALVDVERLLFFWATRRNLRKDIVYQTHSPLPVMERETAMPSHVWPTAYSAYRLYLGNPPADYDVIYFYAADVRDIKERFPEKKRSTPNITVLASDPFLTGYKKTPLAQVFVDLWNLPEWYAKDFSDALLDHIKGKIGL